MNVFKLHDIKKSPKQIKAIWIESTCGYMF